MITPRIIPCLLLKKGGLVKTRQFKDPKYVGDPINAVRIFNEKEVDELVFLDVMATVSKQQPNYELIKKIAAECFMPFGYGGGIHDINQMAQLFRIGSEKVIINSSAVANPSLIQEASREFGRQSIVVSIDVKKNLLGQYVIYTHGGTKKTSHYLATYCRDIQELGAGEVLLNSVDRDGAMEGYDLDLINTVTANLSIPVIACGGAGTLNHMADAVIKAKASAVAAGSMFVFYGKHRAVLINYPSRVEIEQAFKL